MAATNGVKPEGESKLFTADEIKKMEEELEYLKAEKRPEVAERIKVARSFGDLSENAEYDEARKEQSFMEGRILELESLLRVAQVIREEDIRDDMITVGSLVRVRNVTKDVEKEYALVGTSGTDPLTGKISNESPIGAALFGKKVGDTVTVNMPNNKSNVLTVLSISRQS